METGISTHKGLGTHAFGKFFRENLVKGKDECLQQASHRKENNKMSLVSMERAPSKNGVALPMIKVPHPSSRLGDPATINVRGVSRQSNLRFGEDIQMNSPNILRPITADQLPFGNLRSPRCNSLPPLGEDQEMKMVEERTKPAIPVFRMSADKGSPRGSRPPTSSTIATGRVSTDELERSLRDKMKHNYFMVKTAFKAFDPEGKGNVDRESLAKIISNFLNVQMSLSQFNRLMTRFHLEQKKIISFEEFYANFRPLQDGDGGEYPTWLELQRKAKETMTAPQVFMHLKEKARQRFLDMASLVPQKNPGGTRRILKPEFYNAISNLGFQMDSDEYDKLWTRFDNDNIGAVSGEKIFTKLGIALADDQRPTSNRSGLKSRRSTSPEEPGEEKGGVDIERWITDKFREGARDMIHAFYEMDLERKGTVNKSQLKRVLAEYSIELDDQQVDELLQRCDLPKKGPINYKQFIKRYQDRSEIGMPHKILNDPSHQYNQDMMNPENVNDTVAAETKLMELFQTEFLSLLGSFHKLDRENKMILSEKQFRAVIESKFKIDISNENFKKLMDKVPKDENGMVKYVQFMSNFDSKEAKSLFDAKSTIADLRNLKDFDDDDEVPPALPREEKAKPRVQSRDSYDSQDGRSVEELTAVIRGVVKQNFQAIEREFQNLDEVNTKKLNPEMLVKLLKKFDVNLNKNETKRIWDTMITDHKGYLEFMQFVRHFSFRLKSAAFPNSKISPPKRGDCDFKLRSKKLNSAYDMLEDSLRSKVDQHWEALHKHFHDIDPTKTGFVSREEFKNILQSLCIHLTDYECDVLGNKFDILKDGRVCWIEFLKPFSSRRQIYRKGNNMLTILAHKTSENAHQSPRLAKGLPSVAAKIKERFHDDLKQLQRAFKKLDANNNGSLTVHEFILVLKLSDVELEEEESFQLLSELDKGMNGRINYHEFMKKLKLL